MSAKVQGCSNPNLSFHYISLEPIFPLVSCEVYRMCPWRQSLPISQNFPLKNSLRNGEMSSPPYFTSVVVDSNTDSQTKNLTVFVTFSTYVNL